MPITKDKFFKITSVHRKDLEKAGFDAYNTNDATMRCLASKMAEDYCEQLFWDHLPVIAEALKIPKHAPEQSIL